MFSNRIAQIVSLGSIKGYLTTLGREGFLIMFSNRIAQIVSLGSIKGLPELWMRNIL